MVSTIAVANKPFDEVEPPNQYEMIWCVEERIHSRNTLSVFLIVENYVKAGISQV